MATAAFVGATVLSSVVGAVGAFQQAGTQAAVAEFNAANSRNAAIAARDRASADADRRRREFDRIRGRNVANIGAAGLDFTGSPTAFLVDQAGEAELDALLVEYGGELEARGFEQRARLHRAEASSARAGAPLKAAGILLGGASRAATPFLKND